MHVGGDVSVCVCDLCWRAVSQVGQKRTRGEFEAEVEPPSKKVRSGLGAKQWITVYNRHTPMKQR